MTSIEVLKKVLKYDIELVMTEIKNEFKNIESENIKIIIEFALVQCSYAIFLSEIIEFRQYIKLKIFATINKNINLVFDIIQKEEAQEPKAIIEILNDILKDEIDKIKIDIEDIFDM